MKKTMKKTMKRKTKIQKRLKSKRKTHKGGTGTPKSVRVGNFVIPLNSSNEFTPSGKHIIHNGRRIPYNNSKASTYASLGQHSTYYTQPASFANQIYAKTART